MSQSSLNIVIFKHMTKFILLVLYLCLIAISSRFNFHPKFFYCTLCSCSYIDLFLGIIVYNKYCSYRVSCLKHSILHYAPQCLPLSTIVPLFLRSLSPLFKFLLKTISQFLLCLSLPSYVSLYPRDEGDHLVSVSLLLTSFIQQDTLDLSV